MKKGEVTQYGKFIRFWRIRNGVSLIDMSRKMDIRTSDLSAYETGRQPIPKHLESDLIDCFTFSDEDLSDLWLAIRGHQFENQPDTKISDNLRRIFGIT